MSPTLPGEIRIEYLPLTSLLRAPRNPKGHDLGAIHTSIETFGFVSPVILNEGTGRIVAGHGRLDTLEQDKLAGRPRPERILQGDGGDWLVPVIRGVSFKDDAAAEAYLVADNRLTILGGWQDSELAAVMRDLAAADRLAGTGYDRDDVDELLKEHGLPAIPPKGAAQEPPRPGTLATRFLVPPFSVLDARAGYWQDRKRAWISVGIESEVGRGSNLIGRSFYEMVAHAWRGNGPGGVGAHYSAVKAFVDERLAKGMTRDQIAQEVGLLKEVPQNVNRAGLTFGEIESRAVSGTSIFDPVLCELLYLWFSPRGGRVLDPFAGGSVRGAVAGLLGRSYVGIDLRAEQVEANKVQWARIRANPPRIGPRPAEPDNTPDVTPVEKCQEIWVKRDDTFTIAGVRGGKVRTCWTLAQGATGLTTAGSRQSPQVNIVAHVAARLGVPCRVHVPEGELSPELEEARAVGAEIVQHPAGYNNVIIARAREDAAARGWREIPFGMECAEAIKATADQFVKTEIPAGVKRIVVPVGSGMSLAGILHGIAASGWHGEVVGVQVGADPRARLEKWGPGTVAVTLVKAKEDYHDPYRGPMPEGWGDRGIFLDPIYEAKCVPFLHPGDLFWCVGLRQTAAPAPPAEAPMDPTWVVGDSMNIPTLLPEEEFDFVMSCPPYHDLEQYSEDPADLSNLSNYHDFYAAYTTIITKACDRLKDNRFAAFVVGEIRDDKGTYRGCRAGHDPGLPGRRPPLLQRGDPSDGRGDAAAARRARLRAEPEAWEDAPERPRLREGGPGQGHEGLRVCSGGRDRGGSGRDRGNPGSRVAAYARIQPLAWRAPRS
jgi:1-aminocyclopropane-1-carboxylate deaminase/D-cysteine desulfhydrase-like pyridoxal-dependent ACC family enzyme